MQCSLLCANNPGDDGIECFAVTNVLMGLHELGVISKVESTEGRARAYLIDGFHQSAYIDIDHANARFHELPPQLARSAPQTLAARMRCAAVSPSYPHCVFGSPAASREKQSAAAQHKHTLLAIQAASRVSYSSFESIRVLARIRVFASSM